MQPADAIRRNPPRLRLSCALVALVVPVLYCLPLRAQVASDAPAAGAVGEGTAPRYVKQLAEYDLLPTAESLGSYLDSLHPTVEQQRRIDALIAQLGDSDYQTRQSAMTQLVRRPISAREQLQAAEQSDNAEIRWRAKHVLARTQQESRSLLHTVYTAIEREQLPGLVKPLLDSTAFCDEAYLQNAVQRALASSATGADGALLRSQLRDSSSRKRIAALQTLASVAGAGAEADALSLLGDADPSVRCAAARVLASRGRREALPILVRLLDSSDLATRLHAFRTLRALTGESFGYIAYEADLKRIDALKKWEAWLAEHGAMAKLQLPLRDLPIDRGRLLVCDHGQNKLIEFDLDGKETWQRQAPIQPWACQGLPNGHRLVGSYSERSIVEYDNDGTQVWKAENLPGGPTSVERLENGNTLVACTEGAQVVEIGPDKVVVWKATLEGRPVDARRLENGNTLVALQNAQKVVEVSPDGKTVWELTAVKMPFSAQRLPDGNTLVCSLNQPQVREYDSQGKVVWEQGAFEGPYTAQRLADGNTLVVDRNGVYEIDNQGNSVRRMLMKNISRAWRY